MDLYKKIWEKTGNRPWSFSMRDSYYLYPLAWIFVLLGVGVLIGHLFGRINNEDEKKYGRSWFKKP